MSHKVQIVLGASAMEITPEPVASNSTELLNKAMIIAVTPVKFNKKPNNGYLKYLAPSGPFDLGETITGGTSGATAKIFRFHGTEEFYLQNIVGVFQVGETITGGTSTETATLDSFNADSFDNEWVYEYPTMTVIQVEMENNIRMNIELQNVTNQAGWSTGTLAGLNQAIADINAWL